MREYHRRIAVRDAQGRLADARRDDQARRGVIIVVVIILSLLLGLIDLILKSVILDWLLKLGWLR